MRPFLRMTIPRGIERLGLDSIEVGKPIGRSWFFRHRHKRLRRHFGAC